MSNLHHIKTSQAIVYFHETSTSSSPVLLWLHGFCEDHQIFSEFITEIKVPARHIVPDLPGYGKSTAQSNFDFSMQAYAQSIHEMLMALNIQQVHCIGHSMGGYIGLQLAHSYPNLLHSLTLLHSTAAADSAQKKENRNRTIEVVQKDLNIFLREFHQNLFYAENKIRLKTTIDTIRHHVSTFLTADTIIKTLKGLRDRPDYTEYLTQRTFKLNYLIGRHDPILPADEIIRQAEILNARYAILENSGHMGLMEEKKLCAQYIEHFILND